MKISKQISQEHILPYHWLSVRPIRVYLTEETDKKISLMGTSP